MPGIRKSIPFLLPILLLFAHRSGRAQDTAEIGIITGDIKFDGYPGEEAWNEATLFPLTMHSPNFENEPTEKSDVRVGYTQEYLWVGAKLYSKAPSNITSTSKKRDEESRNSDSFGLLLDTYNDNENALAFFTMPSGTRIDYTVSNDGEGGRGPGRGGINRSWNTFWDVKTSRDDQGWYVEMRIPFSSLRFQEIDGKVRMGLILNRRISYANEIDSYPAIDPRYGFFSSLKPSQAHTIELSNVKSHRPLYVAPYAIGGYSGNWELNEEETEYIQDQAPTLDAGLDVKYSLTTNLTMDLTLNTDFAQVEADDQQVNLTRYSLFFPEKRLFFQERSGIFNFSLGRRSDNLFYSRRIGIVEHEEEEEGEPEQVRIFGGARITGRIDKWDVGFLDMQTESTIGIPSENFGVARIRRQVFNSNSYMGGILTSRVGLNGDFNIAYGLDGIFRLFGDDYLDVRLAQTMETGADNNVFSTDPTFAGFRWERRNDRGFSYDLSYNYTGEQMNPEMGFMRRNDVYGFRSRLQYGWIPDENSKIFSSRPRIQIERYSRVTDGGLESMEISPGWFVNTKKGFGMFTEIKLQWEGVEEEFSLSDEVDVPTGVYQFVSLESRIFTSETRPVSTMFRIEAGEFYDGNIFSLEASPILNISSSIQISGSYEFNAINFPDRSQHFPSHIARANVLFMFSTGLSASAFIQFNNANHAFIGNFRVRYNPKEGNDLYLVFNENRGFKQPEAIPVNPPYFHRTILVKYTHTFRL